VAIRRVGQPEVAEFGITIVSDPKSFLADSLYLFLPGGRLVQLGVVFLKVRVESRPPETSITILIH
jgi:hypothetical protein